MVWPPPMLLFCPSDRLGVFIDNHRLVHYVLISLPYGACSPTAGITGVESIIVELTPLLCLLPCPLILLCGWRRERGLRVFCLCQPAECRTRRTKNVYFCPSCETLRFTYVGENTSQKRNSHKNYHKHNTSLYRRVVNVFSAAHCENCD